MYYKVSFSTAHSVKMLIKIKKLSSSTKRPEFTAQIHGFNDYRAPVYTGCTPLNKLPLTCVQIRPTSVVNTNLLKQTHFIRMQFFLKLNHYSSKSSKQNMGVTDQILSDRPSKTLLGQKSINARAGFCRSEINASTNVNSQKQK